MPVIQIDNPDGDWVEATIFINTPNFDLIDAKNRVDGASNRHDAYLFQHGNCSIVYYRVTSPQGALLHKKNVVMEGTPHSFDPAMGGQVVPKTVAFSMAPEGTGMRFNLGGHLTNHTANPGATVLIPNVYVPYPRGQQPEDGEAGAFNPEPGGIEPVGPTLDEIKQVMQDVMGITDRRVPFTQFYGSHRDIRRGMEEKAKDAAIELLDTEHPDDNARLYQDRFFPFLKNAAANPLANVLGGQDAWGRARRDELKAIIREVLHEAQAEA